MLDYGKLVKIHSYKHDRSIHRVWTNVSVLKQNPHELVLGNFHSRVIESNGRYWDTKEPAICFFYDDKWYNVIAMIKEEGINYYCNISSPYVFDTEAVKYIDYDLDLRVEADYSYRILDKEEYNHHAKIMEYSDKLKTVIEESLKEVIEMVERREGPFNHDVVLSYYEMYKKINNRVKGEYENDCESNK